MMILDLLNQIGEATLHVFWIPLAAWTAGALMIDAFVRRLCPPPLLRYRIRQAVLFALPVSLIAGRLLEVPVTAAPVTDVASRIGTDMLVLPSLNVAAEEGLVISGTHVLGLLTLIALAISVVSLARLAVESLRLTRLRGHRNHGATDTVVRMTRDLRSRIGVTRRASVQVAGDDVPMLVPGRTPHILLPTWLVDDLSGDAGEKRLRMAIAHELIHLKRYDEISALVEQWLLALGAFHPLIQRLIRSITFDRETACDASLLHLLSCRRGTYARLLRDVATRSGALHAVALAEPSSTIYERLHAMTSIRFTPSSSIPRTVSIGVLCLLTVGIVACSDAPSVSTSSSEQEIAASSSSTKDADRAVKDVDEYPKIVGGLQAIQESVQYPSKAQQEGVEGRVLVQFVVDANGAVQDATVAKGVHDALDAEALRVVRSTDFTPGQKGGEPVSVMMTLPITFQNAEPDAG